MAGTFRQNGILVLLSLLASFLLPLSPAFAQGKEEAKASGKVVSRFNLGDEKLSFDLPVPDARVSISAGRQSFKVKTGTAGDFIVNGIPAGGIHLLISKEGYKEFSEDIVLTPGDNVIIVELMQEVQTLDPAIKTSDVPLASMRGDTLVFNAAAIPLQESDYAIDLLRQFPGVEVKDGQIAVFGKSIARTYVNGALVFGSSPMSAMENLKGSEVLTMDVYDEQGVLERRDGIERDKDRVINVKTRNPVLSVTDVRVMAYAGADERGKNDKSLQGRYSIGASGKFFSELFQMTGEALGSNAGMSSTTSKIPFVMPAYQVGKNVSLSLEKRFKDALMGDVLRFSYSYGNTIQKRESENETAYFAAGDVPERNTFSSSSSRAQHTSHNFNVNARVWTNPRFELTLSSFLSFSNSFNNADRSEKIVIQGERMNQSPTDNANDRSWRAGGNLSFSPLSHGKQVFSLDASFLREDIKTSSFQRDTLSSSLIRRHLVRNGAAKTANYSLALRKNLFRKQNENGSVGLSLSYHWSHSQEDRDQLSYNLFPVRTDDPANSYDYTYKVISNRGSLEFDFSRDAKYRGSVSLAAVAQSVSDAERYPASPEMKKAYFSLLPAASISFRSLRFFTYSSSIVLPSAEQIRGQIEDSNPLYLLAGNPFIKQSISHSLTVQENFSYTSKSFLFASIGVSSAPIVSKTVFFPSKTALPIYGNYEAPAGAFLSTYENADYSLLAQIRLTSNFSAIKLFGRNATLRLIPQLSCSILPQYYFEVLDHNFLLGPSLHTDFSCSFSSSLRIVASSEIAYSHNWNERETIKADLLRSFIEFEAKGDFLTRCYYDASYLWNGQYQFHNPVFNRSIHRLNFTVGIALGKAKAIKIGLHGVNLLDSGSDYSVLISNSSLSRTWNPVPGRSFLMSLTYRFNNSAKRPLPTLSF